MLERNRIGKLFHHYFIKQPGGIALRRPGRQSIFRQGPLFIPTALWTNSLSFWAKRRIPSHFREILRFTQNDRSNHRAVGITCKIPEKFPLVSDKKPQFQCLPGVADAWNRAGQPAGDLWSRHLSQYG